MKEIWKSIDGYYGLYEVSNLGRVKNNNGLIMAQKPSKDKYVRILLRNNKKYKSEYVHILVARAFIPNPQNKPEVNHIDANKSNNRVDNLEWVTRSENHWHAVEHGLKPICPTKGKYGSDNPCTKPVLQYDLDGNLIREWRSRIDAAKFYGCHKSSITNCVNGYKKTCKGFVWKKKPTIS